MADNIYVDSTATGSGDLGTSSDPYLLLNSVVAGDLNTGGGTTIHIAGEQFLSSKMTNLKNGGAGDYHVWQQYADQDTAKIIGGVRITNNGSYKWTSASNGEYYLEAAAGGDPGLTDVDSGTVDGHYRSISVTANNKAIEQMGSTSADGDAPVIGSMSATEWGFGDNDTLGYSTVYFKPGTGSLPDDYDIIVSTLDETFEAGLNYHRFNDLQILYGNTTAFNGRSIIELNRCVIGNADTNAFRGDSNSTSVTLNNCILTQGHRGLGLDTGTTTVVANNCVFHNPHLVVRNTIAASTITLRNCLGVGMESGVAQMTLATAGFTEQHCFWYPRLNDGTQKLGYISAANWAAIDRSSQPSNYDTDSAIADALATLRDPKINKTDYTDFAKCDFKARADSPLLGSGAPVSGLTTDYSGDTYHATSPNIGIYATNYDAPFEILDSLNGDGAFNAVFAR